MSGNSKQMDETENSDFLRYFDLDKETIKFMMTEVKVKLEEMAEVLDLDPNDPKLNRDYDRECERFRTLKLALIAVDDTAGLSTVDFDDTLDVNRVYGKVKSRFSFDFSKKRGSVSFTPPASPKTPKRV